MCLFLGAAATFGVSYATARATPFVRPGASAAGTGSTDWLDRTTDRLQRVEVAVWGDHLKPWHIRLTTPWATRLLWFEKGRVYNAARGNPLASSAAVSSWSFATGCWQAVGSAITGPLPDPPALSETNRQNRTWATAIEERGWPLRAFTCRISAPMGGGAGPGAGVYTVDGGHWLDGRDPSKAASAIQELRVLPTTPLWPGLIANTAIFGAAFYLLAGVPGALLRMRRVAGCCPRCRYDLRPIGGEKAGCPECGWNRSTPAVPPQSADANGR
ncbi:MAG TPA: hypothetical protein VEB22_11200 [Phycisphaerales bacterium]|nr:hypothetical protein [Phycisphaerales bacterium]